ncbi:MAG: hypothetical protein ACFCUQ_22805, partial [Kiloniellales bacterium]
MSRLAALAGALILVAGLAIADEAPVTVRGGEHKGFGRLVFDFAASTPYTAEIVDGTLLVSFQEPARFDLSPLSRDLEDYIGPSRAGDDGKSVRIPLKAGFTLKHFTLGPKVVIDLIDPPQGLPTAATETPAGKGEQASEAPVAAPAQAPADPVQPAAQPDAKVLVRVGEHPDFSRMVFDWPFSVSFRIEEAPGRATLWFGRPAELDLSRYRRYPPKRVTALVPRAVAEGLAVDLALPKGATLKHYVDGAQVVVDVVGGEPPEKTTAAAQQAAEPAPQDQAKTADAGAPKQQAAAAPVKAPTELLPEGMKAQAAGSSDGEKTAKAAT